MSARAVAYYEIPRLIRDRALPALLLMLLVLSSYAAWNGADWVKKRETAIDVIKADEQKRLEFGRKFVEKQMVMPVKAAVLPPADMAPLSIGQADAYPFYAELFALGDYTMLFKRVWSDIGNPAVRAAGRFDLAFVIVFLLPLIVLACTYDMWSREREHGVAAMVLSQPVFIGSLLAAKALVRAAVVLLPTTLIILTVAAVAGAREFAGLAALALTVLVYGGFWVAVAVVINSFAQRSTEAAIAAGASWLLVVVMLPSLTLAAADLLVPAPSEIRFATDLKARKTAMAEQQRLQRESNPASVRTPSPTIPDRLRNVYAERLALDEEMLAMIATHRQAQDARRQVLDTVRFFLPSVAVQDALDRIAGADADRALEFESQARAMQLQLRRLYKSHLDRDALVTLAEYDSLPEFYFHETGGAFQVGVWIDLAVLLISTFITFFVGHAMRAQATKL